MNKASLLLLLIMSLTGCNKDNSSDTEITNVTGVEWQLFSLQETNDPFINPIPVSWYLKLNKDRSFSLSLHNSTSTGTYSWVQSDPINAKVKFTIQSWNSSVSDIHYTNKLKTILQSIDSCHYLKDPYLLPIPFSLNPAKMELQFHGSAGHFYVFTF
jgi:hypothetical protein